MKTVELKPGWFLRDVAHAVEQKKLGALVYHPGGLTTAELKKVTAFARRLMAGRV